MHVEGIIIQKTPYKERDLICHILLRSGKTLPVYFYGGRGGGKKSKGSFLEIGFMLKLQLREQRKSLETAIYIAKEYSLLWGSDEIRADYQALCLLSFYLEFTSKLALSEDLKSQHGDEFAGLFKVVSNAIFFLDHALAQKQFKLYNHLFLFLSKLTMELGILPDTDHCLFCEKELDAQAMTLFMPAEGGFSCLDCNSNREEFLTDNRVLQASYQGDRDLRLGFKKALSLNFKDYIDLEPMTFNSAESQFQYINYQFSFDDKTFKTWKLIHGK